MGSIQVDPNRIIDQETLLANKGSFGEVEQLPYSSKQASCSKMARWISSNLTQVCQVIIVQNSAEGVYRAKYTR